MNFLNRREFLIASGGILLASKRRAFAENKRRIIVAGAGLAGLSAAFELSRRNFEVTVIEGRNRVGGRVFTVREPFKNGQYVEAGGEILGDGYKRMLAYADEFGIGYKTRQAGETETGGSVADLQKGIGTSAFFKGKLYPRGAILQPHPYNLEGIEANLLPPDLYIKYLQMFAADLQRKEMTLADLDKLSLADALRKKGASETAIRLINISLNYNSIETVSTGGIFYDGQKRRNAGTVLTKIIGGNDRIPKALFKYSQKTGVKFIFNANIKRIDHRENFVRVSFEDENGKTKAVEAEKLVCTIPFSVLRRIVFAPSLPEAKTRAIENLNYTRITKVFLQANRKNWDERDLGSSVWTDSPAERIFSAAGTQKDKLGIFTVWTEGAGAIRPESLTDKKRIEWAKRNFVKILPFMRDEIKNSATKSWTNDKFSLGAYSHFTIGQLAKIQPHIKTQTGAIHFAGEHTAENFPGMEGALESAERVIREIA